METPTPTAAACHLCGTIAGYVHPRTGAPTRTRHLCEACYCRERRGGRLGQWPIVGQPPAQAHTCRWCATTFRDSPSRHRSYCSIRCYGAALRDYRPTLLPVGLSPILRSVPDQEALTLTTWPMDLLCARYDAPRWDTAAWNWCPRDPGFAAYHDADAITTQAAA